MAVGAEGLADFGEHVALEDRHSFCTLFVSDDHGKTWKRDVGLRQADPGSSVIPVDHPGLCRLADGRILIVMQAIDRTKPDQPWYGFHTGMSVIGNIIEPLGQSL